MPQPESIPCFDCSLIGPHTPSKWCHLAMCVSSTKCICISNVKLHPADTSVTARFQSSSPPPPSHSGKPTCWPTRQRLILHPKILFAQRNVARELAAQLVAKHLQWTVLREPCVFKHLWFPSHLLAASLCVVACVAAAHLQGRVLRPSQSHMISQPIPASHDHRNHTCSTSAIVCSVGTGAMAEN